MSVKFFNKTNPLNYSLKYFVLAMLISGLILSLFFNIHPWVVKYKVEIPTKEINYSHGLLNIDVTIPKKSNYIAVVLNNTINFYNFFSSKVIYEIKPEGFHIGSCRFSIDGKYAIIHLYPDVPYYERQKSPDTYKNIASVWCIENKTILFEVENCQDTAISDDGEIVAIMDYHGRVEFWSTTSKKIVSTIDTDIKTFFKSYKYRGYFTISKTGRLFVVHNFNSTKIYEVNSSTLLEEVHLRIEDEDNANSWVQNIDFDRDDKTLILGLNNGSIFYDIETKNVTKSIWLLTADSKDIDKAFDGRRFRLNFSDKHLFVQSDKKDNEFLFMILKNDDFNALSVNGSGDILAVTSRNGYMLCLHRVFPENRIGFVWRFEFWLIVTVCLYLFLKHFKILSFFVKLIKN